MPKSAARLLRALIAEHKRWIGGREIILQQDLASLDESLSNDVSLQSLRGSTTVVSRIGHYYARTGTTKIVEGDQSGWDSIRLSIAYYFWSIKIEAHAAFNTSFLWPQERPFVLELFRKQTGVTLPAIDQSKLGPYAAVLENWDDAVQLEPALFNVCDYHCQSMEDDDGDWDPEFDLSPFDLIPVEVLAILNVRKKMGHTNPQISHPLMQTPLASMPLMDEQLPSDRVLEMTERAFNSVFTR